jgi:hypothetical protein
MLGDAKLAESLLERSGDRVVVGFGVNLAQAPHIDGRKTAALRPFTEVAPQAFVPLLAGKFAQMPASGVPRSRLSSRRAWLSRAHPLAPCWRFTVVPVNGSREHSTASSRTVQSAQARRRDDRHHPGRRHPTCVKGSESHSRTCHLPVIRLASFATESKRSTGTRRRPLAKPSAGPAGRHPLLE